MKRLDYEAPTMEEIVVEMENGFLGGSVDVKNTEQARIDNHTINDEFDLETDENGFAKGEWQ